MGSKRRRKLSRRELIDAGTIHKPDVNAAIETAESEAVELRETGERRQLGNGIEVVGVEVVGRFLEVGERKDVNTVDVNPAELTAEAAQVTAQATIEQTQEINGSETLQSSAAVVAPDVLEQYQLVAFGMWDQLSNAIVPAWNITQVEKETCAKISAQALLLWFPDQIIPPKYLALLSLGGALAVIVGKRRDPSTGALHPRKIEPKPDANATNNAGQAAAPAH